MFEFMISMKNLKSAVVIILLLSAGIFQSAAAQQKFEKAIFYKVIATGDITATDNELTVVEGSTAMIKEGYEGALLMRKGSLVSHIKRKMICLRRAAQNWKNV
jgi:hypothetical protein